MAELDGVTPNCDAAARKPIVGRARRVGQHRMAARTALEGRTLADSLAELRTLEVERLTQ
jgi:hypothetical protein